MTEQQRKALREALMAQGLSRTGWTRDQGDGVYSEFWAPAHGGVAVTLTWEPKVTRHGEDMAEDPR